MGSFPPPTKPWRPHLVCGLIRYRLVVKRESLGSDWLTPPFPVPSFNLTQGRRNNVVYKLVPSGYWIDSFKFCKSSLTKAYIFLLDMFLLVTCPLLPLPLHSRLYHCPSLSSIPSSDAALWKLSRRGLLCSLTLTPVSQPHTSVFSELGFYIHKCHTASVSTFSFIRPLAEPRGLSFCSISSAFFCSLPPRGSASS